MIAPFYERDGITIYVGECLDVLPQLALEGPRMVITDPPYNAGKNYGKTTDDRQEWPEWCAWFDARLDAMLAAAPDVLSFLSITAWSKYLRHGAREPFWAAVWHKPLALSVCAAPFMPHWEPIAFWGSARKKRGEDAAGWGPDVFTCNVETGGARFGHPTPKPIRLMRQIVERTTKPETIVIDPFCGSGTTLRAAKDLGRRAIGIEINEQYAASAVKRLSQTTLRVLADEAQHYGRTEQGRLS